MSDEPHVVETIEIWGVYDGASVLVMSDGTYVNRWADAVEQFPNDLGLRHRFERTEDFIQRSIAARKAAEQ